MRSGLNLIFVSAYLNDFSPEANHQNHAKAREILDKEGFQYQIVGGMYRGSKELSFCLSTDNASTHDKHLSAALNLGLLFNQDSVLEVHRDGVAVLHLKNGQSETLGQFGELNERDAVKEDSYMHEPVTGRYFGVR